MKIKKIKIIHIITKLELGGAQQTTLYTLSHLDQHRYIPVLICGPGGFLLPEARIISGLKVHICKHLIRPIAPFHDLLVLITLWRILKKEKKAYKGPILVHTHSSKAGILGRWAAFLAGIRIRIHTVHGFGINPFQPFLLRWFFVLAEKLTGFLTTSMIYVSCDNRKQGSKLGISNQRNSTIIRSGIEWSKFYQAKGNRISVRKELKIPINSKVVGMIACFKPQKAPLDFVRMAYMVTLKLPETHFVLIGDGILRAKIENMIIELGLQGNVHLTGWRRDIPDLISAMDIMTLTSLWEGLPKVVVEARLMGVPVISTRVSGVEEIIRDTVSGFIVPFKRPDIMAQKAVKLLENPELMRRMGREAKFVSSEFDLDEVVLEHGNLYQSLIKKNEFRNNNLLKRWFF
jgi:glycosyltransferase involved in cell wall biosynthesis